MFRKIERKAGLLVVGSVMVVSTLFGAAFNQQPADRYATLNPDSLSMAWLMSADDSSTDPAIPLDSLEETTRSEQSRRNA